MDERTDRQNYEKVIFFVPKKDNMQLGFANGNASGANKMMK